MINNINGMNWFTNSILGVGNYKTEFCTFLLIVLAILIIFQRYNEDYKQTYFKGISSHPVLDVVCVCVIILVFKLSLDR